MSGSKWFFIPQHVPTDGQLCYIRLNSNTYNYFEATYNATTEIFTSVDNNIQYPITFVWKFKPKT